MLTSIVLNDKLENVENADLNKVTTIYELRPQLC